NGRKRQKITVHNRCGLWIHENCNGSVPEELCQIYKEFNPKKTIDCKSIKESTREEIRNVCGCSCLKNYSSNLPVWPINDSISWDRGKFSRTVKGGNKDYIKIERDREKGKWISHTRDWFQEVNYAYVDTDSEIRSGEIELKIEVSDDDFESIKDSVKKNLNGGFESFGLCNLDKSRYLRLTANFESANEDKELTTLHGIWLYINQTKTIDEEEIKKKYPEKN
ncbi:MAG: hypothetical protein ABEK36_00620, partial [Candidatus Aenigmatarchaeota archaeon]